MLDINSPLRTRVGETFCATRPTIRDSSQSKLRGHVFALNL